MKKIYAIPGKSLSLGRLGENERTQIVFPVTEWLEEYPTASIVLFNRRPKERTEYPVVITGPENGEVFWTVEATELAIDGDGECMLQIIEDEVVAKSANWRTKILPALTGADNPPEPWENLMDDMAELVGEAQDAAAEAATAGATAGAAAGATAGAAAAAGKIDEPASEGTNGQVLTTDGNGGRSWQTPQGGGGTSDYNDLSNKPQIGGVTLSGNKTLEQLGAASVFVVELTTDYDEQTHQMIITSDKTVAEIIEAEDAGKVICAKLDNISTLTEYRSERFSQNTSMVIFVYNAGTNVYLYVGNTDGQVDQWFMSSHEYMQNQYGYFDAYHTKISNVATPTANSDAATKGYVDDAVTGKTDKTDFDNLIAHIAPDYDDLTFPIEKNQPCFHGGDIWIANTDILTQESWTAAHWHKYDIGSAIYWSKNNNELINWLSSEIGGKIDEPTNEGTSGQVLTTDGNGGRSWQTPSGGGGGVSDVQINGTSIVNNGVANVPYASSSAPGVSKVNGNGIRLVSSGTTLATDYASALQIKAGINSYNPIVPNYQHNSVFYGLAKAAGDSSQSASSNAVGTYTEDAKSSISQMLDAPETVNGTTPSITAKAGVRYICGEVSTLSITAPASGCIDVTFTSGSTPTVLTVTSAKANTTIKWANGFDPTSLEADTVYEVNILDGEFGVVGSWT